MTKLPLFVSVAALTLLSACGESATPSTNITTIEIDNESNVTVPGDDGGDPAANDTAGNAVAAAPALALAPDGLTLVLDSGSTRHATFGGAREITVTMVSASLGKPSSTGRNDECGQGPMDTSDFAGGLTLFFQQDKFVGWDLDGRDKGSFTTMNGIGIGSTLKQLREAFGKVEAETSTLGDEFRAGDLGGLLTSLKPDGKVTHLWAGSTCQFR